MSRRSSIPEPGSVSDDVQSVRQSRPVEVVARGGYVVVGVLHLILAWIALRIAFGGDGDSEDADQAGALQEIAQQPAGGLLLWVAAIALVMLFLWQGSEALFGGQADRQRVQLLNKARAGGQAVVHGALAVTTFSVLIDGDGAGDEQAAEGAGMLLGSDVGRVVLFALGLGIIGFGVYQVFVGITQRFHRILRDDMHDAFEHVVEKSGTVGYIARGVALAIVGLLVLIAAAEADPDEAGGLDGALTALAEQPYGPWALVVIGVGFAAFGVFSFGRSRYGLI